MDTFVITFCSLEACFQFQFFVQSVAVETRVNPHGTDSAMCAQLES